MSDMSLALNHYSEFFVDEILLSEENKALCFVYHTVDRDRR